MLSNMPPCPDHTAESPPASPLAPVLRLPPILDSRAAEALLRDMRDQEAAGNPLILDAAAVECAGTPCLQILLAAAGSARRHGLPFGLRSPSAALSEAIAQLGLQQELPGEAMCESGF